MQQVVRLGDPDLLVEAWASSDAPETSVEDAVQEVCDHSLSIDYLSERPPALSGTGQKSFCILVATCMFWPSSIISMLPPKGNLVMLMHSSNAAEM